MGKISRFLALITLFISVVFGACDFSEFDKNFMEVGAKERQRLHNEIKNTYIKSVINDDLECKKASLERLIKANAVFGVDSKTLKKELTSLNQANTKNADKNNADENNTKKSTPKSQNKDSAQEAKKETKNEAKNTEQKTKSRAAQTKEQKSQKTEAKAKVETKKETKAEPKSLRVLEVLSDKNSLKIKLNRNINEDELKNFALNSKDSWRNVYDITGILPSKFPIPQNGISAKIRIAQKDPSTVRIVFEDAKKSQIYAQIDEKEITFSKKLAQNTQKTEQKAEQNTKKTAKKVASTEKTSEKTSENKAEKTVKTQNTKNDKKIAKKPEPVNQKSMKITVDTATAASNKLSKKQKASKIIVLDPGHGGDDVGALSQNKKLREKDIVLNVSKKTASLLKERGYKVLFTRSNDRFIKLRSRTSF
ncbi:N-acetylmuramoyl-L-alanine amidase, partial [Campylobacter sp.]|uniref:N-acetylmuramoyl-L-alanine amidase n=1 Tax=Campylobacter sp. TaxID=205 RepID=UPI002AA8CC43